MSKRTLALIIGLALITGVLLVAALSPQQQKPTKVASGPTPTVNPAHTKLSISVASAGALLKNPPLDVLIDSNGDNSTGVQLELAFDPTVMTNVRLTPGTFYTDPFALINNIDQKNGRVSYAVAIKPNGNPVNGRGIVATIYYDLKPGATKDQVAITFLPKSKATAEGVAPSVLLQTTDFKMSQPTTMMHTQTGY